MQEYSADAPLLAKNEDRFQRWPFASRIARLLAERTDLASIVIGINGAWGEGKTTIFNFIETELASANHVVVIKFNLWRFPEETKLIRDFFQILAKSVDKQLGTRTEKIGSIIGKYIQIPASIVGAGEAAKSVGDLLSTVDLEDVKPRIETILLESGKRVVVLMDDLDRLDKEEIQSVFRLIKLVADLKNTAYILAFDSKMVSSALQERFSKHDTNAGREYLEKIVQLPLEIPQIPRQVLREFTLEIVGSALSQASIELTRDQEGTLREYMDQVLLNRLTTPRMAKRYGNILSFCLPILKNETSPVDLVLIEGIRVCYPLLHSLVRNNSRMFLFWPRDEIRFTSKTYIHEAIDQALAGVSTEESFLVKTLLQYLFPATRWLSGKLSGNDRLAEHYAKEQRICSGFYFQRYFTYSVSRGQISDVDWGIFVINIESQSQLQINYELQSLLEMYDSSYILNKISMHSWAADAKFLESVSLALCHNNDHFPENEQSLFGGLVTDVARLIALLINRLAFDKGEGSGAALAKEIVREAEPFVFALHVLRWVRFIKTGDSSTESDEEQTIKPGLGYLTETSKQEIGSVVVARLKNLIEEMHLESSHVFIDGLCWIFEAWAKYGDSRETKAFLSTVLEANPSIASFILASSRPRIFGDGFRRGNIDWQTYDSISVYADPFVIVKSLETIFGRLELNDSLNLQQEFDEARLLASQFVRIHQEKTHPVRIIDDRKSNSG